MLRNLGRGKNMQKKNYYLESVLDLNASNVWGTEAQELLDLWQKDIKEEGFSSSEEKVLNVIRLAFDVYISTRKTTGKS